VYDVYNYNAHIHTSLLGAAEGYTSKPPTGVERHSLVLLLFYDNPYHACIVFTLLLCTLHSGIFRKCEEGERQRVWGRKSPVRSR